MSITLHPNTAKLIQKRMKQGGYKNPDDVVIAGLASLAQQQSMSDFAPGELDKLLAVADAEIERGEVLDGEEAFLARRQRRVRARKKAG